MGLLIVICIVLSIAVTIDGLINSIIERKDKMVIVVSHEDVSGIDFNRTERL